MELNKLLVLALFDSAQNSTPRSVDYFARDLGRSRRHVADALDDLARAGLVRAETLTLTFLGLALAAKLRNRRSSRLVAAA